MENEKEIRGVSCRATVDEKSRLVEGYALLFNTDGYPIHGVDDLVEVIDPKALNGVLERSDVLCLMNHDESRGVLARSRMGKGTLKLEIDSKGLKYSFNAPNTVLGNDLIESLKRGDIGESSFAFSKKEDKWEKRGNVHVRRVLQVNELFDVSPVYRPAYEDTTVALRSLSDKKEVERIELEKRKSEEFDEYINNLKNKF